MRYFLLVAVLIALTFSFTKAQDSMSLQETINENESEMNFLHDGVTVIDTITKTDTIVVTEVITRTDVIHRTETIVRYGEPFSDDENIEDQIYRSYSDSVISIDKKPGIVRNDFLPAQNAEVKGGSYLWVPDSLNGRVNSVLNGENLFIDRKRNFGDEEEIVDHNEKVIFRGDTIPMMLRDRNLGRFDRGLFNYLFIPKGIWQLGITASYGEFSTEDLEVLDLISDVDFKGHIFSVRPYFAYFLNNNLSLGMRLGYTSGKASIGSFNLDIDDDVNFNIKDVMYKSSTYTGAITFSQYLGIARKGRFGVFNEVELALSGGASDFVRPYNGIRKETHTSTFQVGLNFSPGLCVFIVDQLSFNVSFGVFGLYLKNEKQKVDGENLGSRITSGANFRFNIFNINFGIAVNI